MSEPMTNIEIEDVLSSIRRLVSEDPVHVPAPARPKPLILSSAFRVAAVDPAPVERLPLKSSWVVDVEVVQSARAAAVPRASVPEATSAPVRPADDNQESAGDADRDHDDSEHLPQPEAAAVPEAPVSEAHPAPVQPADDRPETVEAGDREMAHAAASDPWTQPEAEPEAFSAPVQPADDSQETVEDGDVDRDHAAASGAWPQPEAAADDGATDPEAYDGEATGEAAEEVSLEDRIADLEAAIGQSDEEFEPDGSEDLSPHIPSEVLRPSFGTAAADAWEIHPAPPVGNLPDRADDDYDDELDDEIHDEGDPGPKADASDNLTEEALIDEESLREIVADLVRQELRGELGERITRNVRRLVRREVNRALALQDLEDEG